MALERVRSVKDGLRWVHESARAAELPEPGEAPEGLVLQLNAPYLFALPAHRRLDGEVATLSTRRAGQVVERAGDLLVRFFQDRRPN